MIRRPPRSTLFPYRRSSDLENVTSYELGAKSTWLDGKLRLNGAIFYIDYSDQQVAATAIVGGVPASIVTNVGKSTAQGLEVELDAVLTQTLQMRASFSYLDAEYKKYFDGSIDLSGAPLDLAPKYLGVLDFTNTVPMESGSFVTSLPTSYTGETHLNVLDEYIARAAGGDGDFHVEDGFTLVDARIGYQSNGHWEVFLWGRNLTDENYRYFTRDFFGKQTLYGPPRTYGAEFRWNL